MFQPNKDIVKMNDEHRVMHIGTGNIYDDAGNLVEAGPDEVKEPSIFNPSAYIEAIAIRFDTGSETWALQSVGTMEECQASCERTRNKGCEDKMLVYRVKRAVVIEPDNSMKESTHITTAYKDGKVAVWINGLLVGEYRVGSDITAHAIFDDKNDYVTIEG